jgi:ubiquinone/menaquinone biosynthesis C-methylase UbiE
MSDLFAQFGLTDEDRAAYASEGGDLAGWLTDRVARRPTGARARAVYGAEDIHDFARRAILHALALRPGERLLDVGCGGGLLLREACAVGAEAAGVDHSPDMVALARERSGVDVVQARAEALPFRAGSFEAVAMSVVFQFLAEPLPALREAHRVLVPGGRLAIYTSGPELVGTPALPELLTVHVHTDPELEALLTAAGFTATVRRDDGAQLALGRR